MSEFHGYALSVTNHCSHENPGVKRYPIILNPSDTSITNLPDSYVIQPPVELAQTDIFAPISGLNEVRPLVDLLGAKVKDEAWLVHVANISSKARLRMVMSSHGRGRTHC